jgi:hypothetical protein
MGNDRYDEDRSKLREPADPPESLLRPEAQQAALLSYLGPIVILFAVIGVALLYWTHRRPEQTPAAVDRSAIGTAGTETPGGGKPLPGYRSTADEIRTRGGGDSLQQPPSNGLAPLTSVDAVRSSGATPRRVSLSSVEVEQVEGDTVWVRDGDARIAVALPKDASHPAHGDRVDVSGVTDSRDGSIRVVADAVRTR